jgi:F-type H+-transporting ATPase subunit a
VFLYMPATARMAIPIFLAIVVWFIYNGVGIKHQGFFGYFKSIMFPPGVPKPIYVLLTPIELISTIIVRPFSLAIRLFANMLAGHLLLVTFAILTDALITANAAFLKVIFVLPLFMLIFLTGFEILVSVLQAYIFTILTAVYIAGATHPEH